MDVKVGKSSDYRGKKVVEVSDEEGDDSINNSRGANDSETSTSDANLSNQVCHQLVLKLNYAFPTKSVYGFGIKRRQGQPRRTPIISESASNLKILHIVNRAGLFQILFGLNKF